MSDRPETRSVAEWGTLALIFACYGVWLWAIFSLAASWPVLAFLVACLTAALHSSLTHEVLHGHPFRSKALNEALMFLPLTLYFPYNRFRDLHLAHHRDENLTCPENDPESNFVAPEAWAAMPGWKQALYRFNNTLFGRVTFGPLLGQLSFFRSEARAALGGDKAVQLAWALHFVGAAIVLWIVAQSAMPVWQYLIVAYTGMGIIKIRTFLEHRAHDDKHGRTVVVEDRGPLSWLFLNNNFHIVHHMHPGAPWYRLPRLYRQERDRYLAANDAYVYRSYAQVFRQYLMHAKDPVAHPLWSRK